METNRNEPDHGDTIYLEEEPLMQTTELDLLNYLGSQSRSQREGVDRS